MHEPQTVWHRIDRLLARLRPHRQALSLAVDGVVVAVAWNLTYLFRLGFERWWSARADYDALVAAGVVAAYLAAFRLSGVPRGMWRFTGFGDMRRIALACLGAGVACAAAVRLAGLVEVPRAVLALHPFVTLVGVSLLRLVYRMLYEHARDRITGGRGEVRRGLVLGAGEAARLLLAGIHRQGWTVMGLLDDDPAKQGARIGGVPVLGPLDDLARPEVRAGVTHLIFAIPTATGARRRRIFDLAAATGLPVLTVPSAAELREGRSVDRLRDVEPEDLLGREPVVLDETGIDRTLQRRTVLVTGAGGSIGAELCRQVARFAPARLVLYEASEFNLYRVEQSLSAEFPRLPLVRLIGDVRDPEHLGRTFARWRPQVVFHAAAFKHVPLMENDNAWAALRNNTLGTWYAARAAAEHGAERFVLISTDKAVNPTNVMGASKRAAEMVVARMADEHPATRFITVRFGNVLGSSGSVIPKFKEQIARGGPVTVTHPEVIRYFMTIPEAARLVLQAAAIGCSGQVLVLDMGEPVRIVELARDLIRLSGHTEDEIGIEFTGLRPGEKLYEELLADADTTLATPIPALRIARLDSRSDSLEALLQLLADPKSGFSDDEARRLLSRVVPEYRPAGTVVSPKAT